MGPAQGAPRRAREGPVKKDFFPKGAIASFVVMVAFYLGLWFVLYAVMVGRG
jgi:hypothetical protein